MANNNKIIIKMKSLTLKKIDIYTKDKDGKQFEGKFGPYHKVRLTDTLGNQYYGYGNKVTDSYQVGQTVTVEVSEYKGNNGKTYLNFKPLSELALLTQRIEALEKTVFKNEVRIDTEVTEETHSELPF